MSSITPCPYLPSVLHDEKTLTQLAPDLLSDDEELCAHLQVQRNAFNPPYVPSFPPLFRDDTLTLRDRAEVWDDQSSDFHEGGECPPQPLYEDLSERVPAPDAHLNDSDFIPRSVENLEFERVKASGFDRLKEGLYQGDTNPLLIVEPRELSRGSEFQVFDRAGYNGDPSEDEPDVSVAVPRSERKRGRDEEENLSEVSIEEQEDGPRIKKRNDKEEESDYIPSEDEMSESNEVSEDVSNAELDVEKPRTGLKRKRDTSSEASDIEDKPKSKRRKGKEEKSDYELSEIEASEDDKKTLNCQRFCKKHMLPILKKNPNCKASKVFQKVKKYPGCPSEATLARFARNYRIQTGTGPVRAPPKKDAAVDNLWVTIGIPALKKNPKLTASKVIELMKKHSKKTEISKTAIESKVQAYRKIHGIISPRVEQQNFMKKIKETELPDLIDQDLTAEEMREKIIEKYPDQAHLILSPQSFQEMLKRLNEEKHSRKEMADRDLCKKIFANEVVPKLKKAWKRGEKISIPNLFQELKDKHSERLDQLFVEATLRRKVDSWWAQKESEED